MKFIITECYNIIYNNFLICLIRSSPEWSSGVSAGLLWRRLGIKSPTGESFSYVLLWSAGKSIVPYTLLREVKQIQDGWNTALVAIKGGVEEITQAFHILNHLCKFPNSNRYINDYKFKIYKKQNTSNWCDSQIVNIFGE